MINIILDIFKDTIFFSNCDKYSNVLFLHSYELNLKDLVHIIRNNPTQEQLRDICLSACVFGNEQKQQLFLQFM